MSLLDDFSFLYKCHPLRIEVAWNLIRSMDFWVLELLPTQVPDQEPESSLTGMRMHGMLIIQIDDNIV